MKKYSSKLAPLIEDYLEFRAAMGRSTCHASNLLLFDYFCCENHSDLECLNREAVRGWISDEIAKGRGGLQNKAAAIRVFAKYLGGDVYVLPTNTIPKKQAYSPYILTNEELAAFFRVVDAMNSKPGPFIKESVAVLWRLLYTSGLRPQEGRLIKHNELCLKTGEILVSKAKRSKERIVVMSNDMLELCRRFNIQRATISGCSDYFFVNGDGSPLRTHQLSYWFNQCWAQANPNTPAHLLPRLRQYDLRHRYASAILQKWLDGGKNLYVMLQRLSSQRGCLL